MIRFSFANLAETATLTGTTTFTEAETGVGLRFPARPFLRGFSPSLAGGRITLDFGTAKVLNVVALINANFVAATIQGNATDAWGGPTFSQAVTLTQADNDRYHYALRPTFNFRFLSINVPAAGSATDGLTKFGLGGIWAGLLTAPPRDILMDPDEDRVDAVKDVETADGRKVQRLILDNPAMAITAKRLALDETELAAWRVIDRAWAAAPGQAALVLLRDNYTEEVYVMRATDLGKWQHKRVGSGNTLAMFEVMAG